jgi:hypothetical protein
MKVSARKILLPQLEAEKMSTEAENFFRRISRGIGGLVRRAAPILRRVAGAAIRAIPTIVRRTVSILQRLLKRS